MITALVIIAQIELIAIFYLVVKIHALESEAAQKALEQNHNAAIDHNAAIASAARTYVNFVSEANFKALKRSLFFLAVLMFTAVSSFGAEGGGGFDFGACGVDAKRSIDECGGPVSHGNGWLHEMAELSAGSTPARSKPVQFRPCVEIQTIGFLGGVR